MIPARPRGLRGRIALTFGAGALLISGALATSTFLFARTYLYDQREQTAIRQAALYAVYVSDQLDTADADIPAILSVAGAQESGAILVHTAGRWYSSSLGVESEAIPAELAARVDEGRPALSSASFGGAPALVVGIPLHRPTATFYRIVPLGELRDTIRILGIVLAAGAAVAAAGGILVGLWASRRVVQPLNLVAGAAAQIAGGHLDTRLPPTDDPDIATIVGSFNAMVDILEQRIERDGRFAADVSHELRSPLTTLVTGVEVMQRRRDDLPERSRQALDLVRAELERFRHLLDSLLTLARADVGLDPDQFQPVPLTEVIRHAMTRAGVGDGVLTTSGPGTVVGEKALLERAFFNLFENAIRHGQGLVAVRLDDSQGKVVTVVIDDRGPGVPPSERDRIFERFATNRVARRSSSGAGLGLALVAESINAHGGTVRCTDHDAPGARFVVTLPGADRA